MITVIRWYNSNNGHPRFTLKMAKFDRLQETPEWMEVYTYPTNKGSSFFSFLFFKLLTLFDDGAAKTAEPIWTRNMSIDNQSRIRPVYRNEEYWSKTLILKRSKSAILFDPQNFDPNFLENGTRSRDDVNGG